MTRGQCSIPWATLWLTAAGVLASCAGALRSGGRLVEVQGHEPAFPVIGMVGLGSDRVVIWSGDGRYQVADASGA